MRNRDKQRRAEEQLEKHHALDNNLSIGMKVAVVAVGGVVVGAITAGIGLVPYIAVVGAAAVASGSAGQFLFSFSSFSPFSSFSICIYLLISFSCLSISETIRFKINTRS